jgi:hypothetical protein
MRQTFVNSEHLRGRKDASGAFPIVSTRATSNVMRSFGVAAPDLLSPAALVHPWTSQGRMLLGLAPARWGVRGESKRPGGWGPRGLAAPVPWLMDSEISALEQKLSKTRAIKQGMMQELLTGRIRLV